LTIAAEKLVDMGVTVIASVDNDPNIFKTPFDACFTAPAKSSKIIAVGASTRENQRAWFSQYGFCLNIFAPGTCLELSAYAGGGETDFKPPLHSLCLQNFYVYLRILRTRNP